MQTFLPYSDFMRSAKVLDYKRLGKQRVEAWQIYTILKTLKANPEAKLAWKNHPCVKMWKGYEYNLLLYGYFICKEWINRGYKDTMLHKFKQALSIEYPKLELPKFIGNNNYHLSHRLNLLYKNPSYYKEYFSEEIPINKPEYIWSIEN